MMIQKYIEIIKEKKDHCIKRLFLVRRAAFMSLVMVPVTSFSATMTFYIDNTVHNVHVPHIHNQYVIALDEEIIVEFEKPIDNIDDYSAAITTFPSERLKYTWNKENNQLTVTPHTLWKPNTRYTLGFPHKTGKVDEGLSHMFIFQTVDYPQIISHTAQNNSFITSEGDIAIVFDRDISQYDIQAVTRPVADLDQVIDHNTNTLHVRISKKDHIISPFYTITVFGKYSDVVGARHYPLGLISVRAYIQQPEQWPHEFSDLLNIAQLSTIPQITEGKYIDVNLASHVTTLFENGVFVHNFVNSSGAKDTPTPTGTFEIHNKDPYALSNMFGVYLPYWMAFTANGEYGFHDLIVWPEGHVDMPSGGKESVQSIGNAVSPGCVRHDADESRYIYEWTDIGTPVVIYE